MNIEESWTVAEPVERLEEIPLDNSRPDWITRIGTLANSMVRWALATFLKQNKDVFAWSHEDMPGIDPLVMVHRLNVSPSFPLVHQKKRVLSFFVFTPILSQFSRVPLVTSSFLVSIQVYVWILECNTQRKKKKKRKEKRETLKVGYLSKSFCRVNFIINIIKGVFRKLGCKPSYIQVN